MTIEAPARVPALVPAVERLGSGLSGTWVTAGFTAWKRAAVAPYFRHPGVVLRHRRTVPAALEAAARAGGPAGIVVWGADGARAADDLARARGVGAVHLEDGFIRSVGLGLSGALPASLVFDAEGVHFDPTRPSAFERLARETVFDEALLARAARLRARVVAAGLTKYNVAGGAPLPDAGGRERVLVPGQVEGDASLRFGAPGIARNADLLAAVRRRRPDAFVLYKPHPDVLTGFRAGAVPDAVARDCADAVVTEASMAACLAWADRVETMTSLTGFEALMRGKAVCAHGQPFYAGWGLTEDLVPPPRRGRPLPLDALVAVALILYPAYVDPVRGRPCPVEACVERLALLADPARRPLGYRLAEAARGLHAAVMNTIETRAGRRPR